MAVYSLYYPKSVSHRLPAVKRKQSLPGWLSGIVMMIGTGGNYQSDLSTLLSSADVTKLLSGWQLTQCSVLYGLAHYAPH